MNIGILGGRFDPPHTGHLKAAENALRRFSLDEVWFVPVNIGNLRKGRPVEAGHRLRMLDLSVKNKQGLKVSEVDIKRGGVTYTIDTIRDLKRLYPGNIFYFIIGKELEAELPKWKDYEKLKHEIEFLLIEPIKKKGVSKISSSDIRNKIKNGLSVKGLVTEAVEEYIFKKNLYS